MTKAEKITFKAKQLVDTYLVDYIETTDYDDFKPCLTLIQKEVERQHLASEKIQFLTEVIEELESRKTTHQRTCIQKVHGNICYFEEHFEEAILFAQKVKKQLILNQQMMTFDDKIRVIFKELATRPHREGDLEEILQTYDISYIRSDLTEFIQYFKTTGMVNTSRITKDGLDIILNQSGLDYLRKSNIPPPAEKNIIINENYNNSIVAKGESVNQSGLSFSIHQEATMPHKTENNHPKENAANNAKKPASPTRRIQIWQFIVAIVSVIIATIMLYLKFRE